MRRIKLLIIIILLGLQVSVSCQEMYRNSDPRFSINIPSGWTIKKPSGPNVKLLFVHPSGSNVNIVTFRDPSYKSFQSYDLTEAELSRDLIQLIDYRTIEFSKTLINARKAVLLKSEYTYQNLNQKAEITSLLFVLIHQDVIYYITCATGASIFPEFEEVFIGIVKSFKIEEDFH